MNNYQRSLIRLQGFCDGAGVRPMNAAYQTDADYAIGYTDGQKAKHKYAKASAKELDVKIRKIVLMKTMK